MRFQTKCTLLLMSMFCMLACAAAMGQTVTSVTTDSSSYSLGSTINVTVTLDSPAPSGDFTVSVNDFFDETNEMSQQATILEGNTSTTIQFTLPASVGVDFAPYDCFEVSSLTSAEEWFSGFFAIPVTPSSPAIQSVTFNKDTFSPGEAGTYTITLVSPLASDFTVIINSWTGDLSLDTSADPNTSYTIPAGTTSVTLPVSVLSASDIASGTGCFQDGLEVSDVDGVYSPAFSSPISIVGISGLTLASTSLTAGSSTSGILTVVGYVPQEGAAIILVSSDPHVIVPPTVTVPTGSATAVFPVWTDPDGGGVSATVTGSDDVNSLTSGLNLAAYGPGVAYIASIPTYVVGGSTCTGVVQVDHRVTAVGGELVTLSSANVSGLGTAAATVPGTVTIPQGANSITYTISAASVTSSTPVSIIAFESGNTQTSTVVVLPPGGVALGLYLSTGQIFGGNPAQGTVTLSSPQATDTIVTLASNNINGTVPPTVTIPAGSTSSTFTLNTSAVVSDVSLANGGWGWLAASFGDVSHALPFTIYAPKVHGVIISPGTVIGGTSTTGTVILTGPAPTGGATVSLSSSDPSASVPATVLVPEGSVSTTFTITTLAVSADTLDHISATCGGNTRSYALMVGYARLISLSVTGSTTIEGGNSKVITVTLQGPAGPSGTPVSLASNSAVATVPSTVLIPAGSTSATFTMDTTAVSHTVPVVITGSFGRVGHLYFKITKVP